MTGNASDAEQMPGMETESGAAESGWRWGCPRESEQIWEREGRRTRSWAREPAWAEEEGSKGGSERAAEAGDNLRGGYNMAKRPRGAPKGGNTDELIFKEYVSYLFK